MILAAMLALPLRRGSAHGTVTHRGRRLRRGGGYRSLAMPPVDEVPAGFPEMSCGIFALRRSARERSYGLARMASAA